MFSSWQPPPPPLCWDHRSCQIQDLNTLFTFLCFSTETQTFLGTEFLSFLSLRQHAHPRTLFMYLSRGHPSYQGLQGRSSRRVLSGDLRMLNEPSGTGACIGILQGQFNSFGSFLNSWKKGKRKCEELLSWPIVWRTTFRQGEDLLMTPWGRNTENSALNPSDYE